MADREVKIRVRLDTAEAKAELQGLVGAASAAGQRAFDSGAAGGGGGGSGGGATGFGIAGALGGGIRALGLGAGIGAGIGLARSAIGGAASGAAGDVFGEAFGPIGNAISQFMFGGLPAEARAGSAAREEAIAAYGYQVGMNGDRSGAKSFYNARRAMLLPAEKGRLAIEGDESFYGVKPEELVNKLLEAVGKAVTAPITAGFHWLNNELKHLVLGGQR